MQGRAHLGTMVHFPSGKVRMKKFCVERSYEISSLTILIGRLKEQEKLEFVKVVPTDVSRTPTGSSYSIGFVFLAEKADTSLNQIMKNYYKFQSTE